MSHSSHIQQLVVRVVAAYVGAHHVVDGTIPELIRSVHTTFAGLGAEPAAAALNPAVPIKKSAFPNYLICLEDGIKLKTMKRHLWTEHGMTPETYRERWKLPDDYPMVAATYSAHRSELAKKAGLGRTPAARTSTPIKRVAAGAGGKRVGQKDTV